MPEFYMAKNDRKPSLEAVLMHNGVAVNLTGCTAKFYMKKDDTVLIDGHSAVIVDATAGLVRYDWGAGETNVEGKCSGEFEITFADNKPWTFPAKGDLIVNFRERFS